mmetsp:Transcript_12787/g.14247  ORF Transcript_12787/g.14247 Transcript_12787/m.14247 type:complete len:153 (-) Transcript_12787:29-487(-)
MQKGNLVDKDTDDDEKCSRGLEYRVSDQALKRKIRRGQAWLSVFKDQELRRLFGCKNEEAMAKNYQHASKNCAGLACNRGQLDEINVYNNYGYTRIKEDEKRYTIKNISTKESTSNNSTTTKSAAKKEKLQHCSTMYYPLRSICFLFELPWH